ncbi:MAG: mechanosensitive ion channel family protein [Giesbergeria sp.]|nr:mechanosensitive ion channel family protein [Comamonadaceae bacterium]
MQQVLDLSFAGNDVLAWARAALWILGAVALMKFLLPVVIRRISRWAVGTTTHLDDAVVKALGAVRWWMVALVALYPASHELALRAATTRWLSSIATVAFFLQLALCASAFISAWFINLRQDSLEKDPSTTSALSILNFVSRVVVWAILLLLLLDNLGFDVNALVAGLGIGGIAIGLALQNILGDLFASLSIVLDKPFQVGDFVVIDDFSGTVENIGLKTTRLRSLSGEVLVFSNGDLTKSRLRNYKLMKERRIPFTFGLTFDATPEQIEQVPDAIQKVIGAQTQARFDRAHFTGFGGSSLDFEVVYWMLTPDYTAYRDVQQAINLGMMRAFAAIGVEFAFPVRTLVVGKQNPLAVSLAQTSGAQAAAHGVSPGA